MSEGEERRGSPRILSEFAVALSDERGALLDERAIAHDVSGKGFKLETQAPLAQGQLAGFSLALGGPEEPVRGMVRVVWVQPGPLATWAGVEFKRVSWSDRRRMRRFTDPSAVDWTLILDKAFRAGAVMLLTLGAWKAAASPVWREVLGGLFPVAVAAAAMGWALVQLLKPRR